MSTFPKSIIKVQPIDKYFRVNWRFDTRCNYDCCYCAPSWHQSTEPVKTLDELQLAWTNVIQLADQKKLPLQVSFVGGEPTANKNFLPFLEWIYSNFSDKIGMTGFSTNGSAPKKVYLRLIQLVDYISFSVHSEFFNEEKFFDTVIATKAATAGSNKRVNVSIMDEPWNRERFEIYKKILTDNNVDWKINYIDWNLATRSFPIKNVSNTLLQE
jgi:MoaA/NifB/PqqE/SkfB family radical SAM enzyme